LKDWALFIFIWKVKRMDVHQDTTEQRNEPQERKMRYVIKWVVSPHRKDKRTGALDPAPMDTYTRYAFDEVKRMFKQE
jgi:hypothetical protein